MKFFQKTLSYGIDRQRVMQTLSDGTTTRTKRYFTPVLDCLLSLLRTTTEEAPCTIP